MRRRVAVLIGSCSASILVMTVIGGLTGGPVARAAPGGQAASTTSESHAPMIPAPGPPGIHAATAATIPWTSSNWSGYAITGVGYTSVTGQWTVPTVTAPTKKRSTRFSSTWVGIDGFNNSDLIQAGTEQDWQRGTAFYQAWWEILPAFETPITTMTIHPGDIMNVSIAQGFPDWTITVTDQTTAKSFTTTQPYAGGLTSAEWIQEAPTVGSRVAPLAHDSTVEFDYGTVNGLNAGLVKADSGTMVRRGKAISTPSLPDPAGNAFAVAFGSVAPPAPTI